MKISAVHFLEVMASLRVGKWEVCYATGKSLIYMLWENDIWDFDEQSGVISLWKLKLQWFFERLQWAFNETCELGSFNAPQERADVSN